jgi:hypothetical protein
VTESTNEGHVGFTGTRHGMTSYQREVVAKLLEGCEWLHHGDCLGSDVQAHGLAMEMRIRTAIHPPTNESQRAFCAGQLFLPPLGYLARNRAIVNATGRLIATPHGYEEEMRSGTWSTIRFAHGVGKPVTIVFPDGSILHV